MNEELTLKLKRAYPDLTDSLIDGGFACDDGWAVIIDEALDSMSKFNVSIQQIKQKFGGLRIYFITDQKDYEAVESIVSRAEKAALTTCEVCGMPGELRERSYLRVLCDECIVKGK